MAYKFKYFLKYPSCQVTVREHYICDSTKKEPYKDDLSTKKGATKCFIKISGSVKNVLLNKQPAKVQFNHISTQKESLQVSNKRPY